MSQESRSEDILFIGVLVIIGLCAGRMVGGAFFVFP